MEIDDELKNRIAGAVVVTILAVIFLPMLFDDPDAEKIQEVSELGIPPKHQVSPSLTATILPENANDVMLEAPEMAIEPELISEESRSPIVFETAKKSETIIPAPVKPLGIIPATLPKIKPIEKSIPLVAPAPIPQKPILPKLPVLSETTQKSSQSQAQRWFIQIASFTEQKNALVLKDKLRNQGFAATVTSNWTQKGRVFRVKVGPELNRQRAETTKERLNRLNNVNSIIVAE